MTDVKWATLHLLACEDCRQVFDSFGLLQDFLHGELSVTWEEISEPSEVEAVDLMLAMGLGGPFSPGTSN